MGCSEREWEVASGRQQASRVHQLTGSDVIPNVMLGVVFQPGEGARAEKASLLTSLSLSPGLFSTNYFISLFSPQLECPRDRSEIYCPSKNAEGGGFQCVLLCCSWQRPSTLQTSFLATADLL